tara:strand:+ start:385 stop:786 length:402 start_codon:yes stop_codon:yes gene_type:complete
MQSKTLLEVFSSLYNLKEVLDQQALESKDSPSIQAGEILEKYSKKPTNWANIFKAIEAFRNDLLSDDIQDSSATESQMALVVPMIAYFVLVLETDLLATPIDTKVIINTIVDNFKKQDQVDKLKQFLDLMHDS